MYLLCQYASGDGLFPWYVGESPKQVFEWGLANLDKFYDISKEDFIEEFFCFKVLPDGTLGLEKDSNKIEFSLDN